MFEHANMEKSQRTKVIFQWGMIRCLIKAILHDRLLTSVIDTGNMGSLAHGKQLHVQLPLVLLHIHYRLQSKQHRTYFHACDMSSSDYFIK